MDLKLEKIRVETCLRIEEIRFEIYLKSNQIIVIQAFILLLGN